MAKFSAERANNFFSWLWIPYDCHMNRTAKGPSLEGCPKGRPGIAKTKRAKLFQSRTLRLIASSDARWGELFDAADVMSEGAPRGEGDERAYFGSTNIILLIAPEDPRQTAEMFVGAVARDPHVRLRAMRVARREAAQRAKAPLDRVRTEITVSPCATGVAVHVEVEALVLPDRRGNGREEKPSAPELPPIARGGAALTVAESGGALAVALPALPASEAALALSAVGLPVESSTLAHPVAAQPTGAPP